MIRKRSGKRAATRLRLEPKGNLSNKAAGYRYIRKVAESRADLKART